MSLTSPSQSNPPTASKPGSAKRWFKRRRKRLLNKISVYVFRWAIRYISNKTALEAERIGAKWGRLAMRLDKKHRRRAESNIKLAFPELTEAEAVSLAKRCFEHFGMLAADFMRTDSRTDEEIVSSCESKSLDQAVGQLTSINGVIGVTGHFGNWERIGAILASRGLTLNVVQRDANESGLNQEMIRLREAAGMKVLSRGNAAMNILRALKSKQVVGVLADQNCEESFVPFFGLPTGTVLGPATLSLRAKAPIIPMYCVRIGPDSYRVITHPPLEAEPGYESQELGLAAAMNASLEKVVREYPEQWLWLHDRWKSARNRGLIPS